MEHALSFSLILCALLLPIASGADETTPRTLPCPAGSTRTSGTPDTAIFSKAASQNVRGHWCEKYDAWGTATRAGPYWETYADLSIRTRGTYVNSRLEGTIVSFHESGALFLRGFLADGQWTGAFEIFHENGSAWFQANMRDGKLDGPVATFFQDGGLESETRFQAGREDGLARSFFAASAGGRLKSEAHIEADAFIGKHRLLDRTGALRRTIDWDAAPIDWRQPESAAPREPERGPAAFAPTKPLARVPASPAVRR